MNIETELELENLTNKKKAIGLIHRVYLSQLKNSKFYIASTKTRSEIRGGGRKPWRQKGTGNARAGSTRSPLFVGGGVIFGPKPRIVSKKINKKERRLALLSAFSLRQKELVVYQDNFLDDFSSFKTKIILEKLASLGVSLTEKVLWIVSKPNRNLWLATRNVKNIEIVTANCVNLTQLLSTDRVVLSNHSRELIDSLNQKSYA